MQGHDVIILGGGIAGLWIGNALQRARYDVIVIEKESLGCGQTLASQGMIHGGQKYALRGTLTSHAVAASNMLGKWEENFAGKGEIDLSAVQFLSETQVMWPAGSRLFAPAVAAAARLVSSRCKRLDRSDFPPALRQEETFKGPVYSLPEKVLDVRSLLMTLASNLRGRLFRGDVTAVTPQGEVVISGQELRARCVVLAAGAGNERLLEMLQIKERLTQRRPLRQIMVRPLPYALFGHGIANQFQPRVTVTSHFIGQNDHVWYLGGGIAEKGAHMAEEFALAYARNEMQQIFPATSWEDKEWATWYGDRAEPLDEKGELPPGPVVRRCGRVLATWPTKLTFLPGLSDRVFQEVKDLEPGAASALPALPSVDVGSYPWELARWHRTG